MNLGEAIKIALHSLWAHKLRSVLTLLGVVIGVTSVIAVVSFVNGLNSYVAEKVFNLGADVFIVNKSANIITNIDDWIEAQKRKDIKLEDYEAVRTGCHNCRWVGATLWRRGEVKYGNDSLVDVQIRGWSETMNRIYDLELIYGRYFTESELNRTLPAAVIGWDIKENLLAGVDPIGKQVRVDREIFQVIGVGKKQGSALGQSRDNYVIMPITSFQKRYGTSQSVKIWGKAFGETGLDAAMDDVRLILRARRHLAYDAKDDFVVDTNKTFLTLWSNLSSVFFAVTIAIASISLVVGGIVIMNIMLVSVTERTREIGLRKSVGARRRDILLQFLIESSTIAAVGGLWGILLGLGLAKFVSLVTPLPSAVKLWSVVLGLVVSTSVGLFFGIYPANKAARLDPVVALRAE